MAGGKERILRRRIRSIQSTKKITRAMELIAASRIVRAQQRVAAARPYSEQITEVIRSLAASGAQLSHPLLTPRPEVRRVAFVVIAADRGLCGAYNSSVIRAGERALQAEVAQGREYSLVPFDGHPNGKANEIFAERIYSYIADHAGLEASAAEPALQARSA